MTEIRRRKYKNSPLIEVLCEINFTGHKHDSTIPGYFHKLIEHNYPLVEEGERIFLEPKNEGHSNSPEIRKIPVTRFKNADDSEIVQLSESVLTINVVKGRYEGYERFSQNIKNILAAYFSVAKPESVSRLRLRYINFIQIPYADDSSLKLNEYFNYFPVIKENIFDFELQFGFPAFHNEHIVFVNLSSLPDTNAIKSEDNSNLSNFIIDINDIYIHDNAASEDFILKVLQDAHENTGRVFEKIITDETRKIFKEVEDDACIW